MTQATEYQQQGLAAAAASVEAKLQSFHEGLTPDERLALDIALLRSGVGADSVGEVTGYANWSVSGALGSVVSILLTTDWAPGRRLPNQAV